MTLKEVRAEFKERIRFASLTVPGLDDYYRDMQRTFEDLWKNGTTDNFSNDFLRFANGYQINTGDYEDLHIRQTLDLRSITATKAVVKDMMVVFLS